MSAELTQQRLSVIQSPRAGGDYPFIGDAPKLSAAVLDLMVQHRKGHVLPFQLHSLLGIDSTPTFGIEDANSEVVFTTLQATYLGSRAWGTFYVIHRWVYKDLLTTLIVGTDSVGDVSASTGTLDPRTCVPALDTVNRLDIYSYNTSIPVVSVTRDNVLNLLPGKNMEIDAVGAVKDTDSGARARATLTFDAIAGGGQGFANICDDGQPAVRSINQVASTSGSFLLSGDLCLRIEPTLINTSSGLNIVHGKIRISDDCKPCCDCDDYLKVFRAIERLGRLAARQGLLLTELREQYLDAHDFLSVYIAEFSSDITVQAARAGDCLLSVAGGYYNDSQVDVDSVELEIQLYKKVGTGLTQWEAVAPTDYPNYGAAYSQLSALGNYPLVYSAPNIFRVNVGGVKVCETKSIAFAVRIPSNSDIQVRVTTSNGVTSTVSAAETAITCR